MAETTLKVQTHHSYCFILWAAERGLHHPAEITRPLLERYQRHLYQYRKRNGDPLTTRTQRTAVQPIQVWFRWMTQQNLLLENPAADLELPRLEKRLPRYILSVDEVEQVLVLPDLSTPGGIRDRALMEVLWWIQRYLHHVRPQLLVNSHCKALFVALDGVEGLGPNGITRTVSHYMKASGLVAHGSCHLFRHAMATQMLEDSADLWWIQAMLGHASVESTQIYTQVSVRALQAVHASTHPAERDGEEQISQVLDVN